MRSIGVLALPLAGLLAFAGCSSSGTSGDGQTRAPRVARQSTSHSAPPTRPLRAPAAHSSPARPRHTSASPAPSPAAQHFTVVLNPGHNGDDGAHPAEINRLVPMGYGQRKPCETTGTETNAGYAEHAFNWDVALRVRRILVGAGVHVIMTRPNDTGVGPCVDRRAAIGNRPSVDAVVSIHADGAPASGHGFHVNQDSRRPDGATAAVAHQSIELGRAIHAALTRSSGLVPSTYIGRNGYYYRDDLAGLNLARRPATFLELGNMKNPGDAALQSSPAGRQRIAAAIAAGILAFLGA